METFRCPTCIGVLPNARVRRCTSCGQNLRRRRPRVLGEDGAAALPVDRWMLDRLHGNGGKRRNAAPPPAWEGRFTSTRRVDQDDVPADTPTPATEFASSVVGSDDAIDATLLMFDAPSADASTDARATIAEPAAPFAPDDAMFPSDDAMPEPEPIPEPLPEPALLVMPEPALTPMAMPEPEPTPEPEPEMLAPAPAPRPQPIQKELDPEVRALIDELYELARAELSGDDVAFFAPVNREPVGEPSVNTFLAEPSLAAWMPAPQPEDAAPEQPRPQPPATATHTPAEAPPAAPASTPVKRPGRARSGWVAAIQTGEWRNRPRELAADETRNQLVTAVTPLLGRDRVAHVVLVDALDLQEPHRRAFVA